MAEASEDLERLEEESWTALSSGGDVARAFFDNVLDDDVLMLLPGGMVMTDRDDILGAMGEQPWAWFRINDLRTIELSETAAILTYRATAQRERQPEYTALISSGYRLTDGSWRLCFHQQTPA